MAGTSSLESSKEMLGFSGIGGLLSDSLLEGFSGMAGLSVSPIFVDSLSEEGLSGMAGF